MTREEAIEILQGAIKKPNTKDGYLGQAIDMAIKSLEQEPCEDAISRQAVLDGLASIAKAKAKSDAQKSLMGRIMFFTEHLPSVNPQEQKTGHWIIKDDKEQGYDIGGVKTWYVQIMCSECGFIKTAIEGHTGQYKYCPHCGARIVEP